MSRQIAALLTAAALVFAGAAAADIYRYVDEDGNVIYSDQPHPDAEKVLVPEVQTYSAPEFAEPPPPPVTAPPPAETRIVYLTFGIVRPADDQPIRSNNGDLDVEVLVEPSLDSSHELRLSLDDQPWGEPGTDTTFALKGITRGTHTLSAEIIDDTGAVVKRSDPITFHLLRVSAAN